MVLSILQAIAAIPQILTLLRDFTVFMKDTFGDNWSKFLVDSHEAFTQLKEADTKEKKLEAGKKLQDLLNRL